MKKVILVVLPFAVAMAYHVFKCDLWSLASCFLGLFVSACVFSLVYRNVDK